MDPRVALDLGIIKIHWYGIIVTLGMGFAVWIASREFKRRGMNPNIVSDGAVWVIGLGILGARLYHVFSSPNDGSGSGWAFYRDNPLQILATWNGGLGIWGGIIGGILGIIYVMWRNKVLFFRAADAIVPGVLLGQSIGRWANFVNQELYGGPTGSDWFGLLIDPQYRVRTRLFDFTDLSLFPQNMRFHPTFLYESIWNFCGFLLLMWLARNQQENPALRTSMTTDSAPADVAQTAASQLTPATSKPTEARSVLGTLWPVGTRPLRDGDIGPLFLIWYALGRSIIELLFRPDAWTLGALPTAVWVSIVMITVALGLLALNRRKRA